MISLYPIILSIITVCCLILAWYAFFLQGASEHKSFSLMSIEAAIWTGAYALELLSPDLGAKLIWAKVQYIGIALLPVTWLIFTIQYTGLHWRFARQFRGIAILYLVPLVTIAIAWTNDLHGLLWAQVEMPFPGDIPGLVLGYGAWFWVFAVYGYGMQLAGVVILALGLRNKRDFFVRWQIILSLLGILVPWLGNVLHILRLSPVRGLDYTPIGFSIAILFFAVNIFLFRMMGVIPQAFQSIFIAMSDPVVILDGRNQILELNKAAARLFRVKREDVIGLYPGSTFGDQLNFEIKPGIIFAHPIRTENERRYYDIQINQLKSWHTSQMGSLIILHDVTQEKKQEEDLRDQQKILEQAVTERTEALQSANEQLHHELGLRRQAEDRYRTLFEEAPVMYVVSRLDQDSLIIQDCNRFFLDTLGYEKSEVLGRANVDFYHPDSREKLETGEYAASTASPFTFSERQLLARDGRIIETLFQAIRVTDESGKATTVRGMYMDISELKKAERNLRRMVAQRQQLLEVSQEMVSILEPELAIDQTLAKIKDIVGYDYCVLYWQDETTLRLKPVRLIGNEDYLPFLKNLDELPENAISQRVFESGRAVLANNSHLDPGVYYSEGHRPALDHIICLPIRVHGQIIGTCRIGRIQDVMFTHDDFELVQLFINLAGIAIHNARLFTAVERQLVEIHEHETNLRLVSARLQEIQESERKQLATELHDRVGQNLTALGVNLNIIRMLAQGKEFSQIESKFDDSLALLEETTRQVRDVLSELRPPALDDRGLMPALRLFTSTIHARTGLEFEFLGADPAPRLPPKIENGLFRITQEAVYNIIRHSLANHVRITLETSGRLASLKIEDDGLGFDPGTVSTQNSGPGYGLITMRERAAAIGGELKIISAPGKGTCVQVNAGRKR